MSVVIKTVASKEDLKIFVKFPLQLYKDCPYYVPNLFADEMATLDPQQNAMGRYSLTRLFLAYKDGQMAGRIAAIINRIANTDWNHAEVRFGWADFIDDKEVSKALVDAVIAFGKENGMTSVAGPLGFTDFDNEGCVVEGFDDISSFMLKYNYPYYGAHFEALGMEKINDWLEYRVYVPDQVPEKVVKAAKIVSERYNLHVRKITKREVKQEQYGRKLFELVNRTYSKLFDFTVLPSEVIDQYVDTFLGILDMRYITLVEDAAGNLVAMAINMPSIAHAVKKEMASEMGNAAHTPSTPMIGGSAINNGKRKIICLESERNMLIFAFPILWKKLVITACEPINGKTSMLMRIPCIVMSMSSLSVVKSLTHG